MTVEFIFCAERADTYVHCIIHWRGQTWCVVDVTRKASFKGCACVKTGNFCVNCLPSHLGTCLNTRSPAPIGLFSVPTICTAHMADDHSDEPLSDNDTHGPSPLVLVDAPHLDLDTQTWHNFCPLPTFVPSPRPDFVWGALNGQSFSTSIKSC